MSRVRSVVAYMASSVVVATQTLPENFSIDAVRVSVLGPDGSERTAYLSSEMARLLACELVQAALEVRPV